MIRSLLRDFLGVFILTERMYAPMQPMTVRDPATHSASSDLHSNG